MLKGIPEILSPELLKVLCEMGHSDRLVIADGNFPVESMGKNAITIRCDGHGVPEILEAILKVFPLDTYVAVSYTHLVYWSFHLVYIIYIRMKDILISCYPIYQSPKPWKCICFKNMSPCS